MKRIVRFGGPQADLVYKTTCEALGIFKAGAREEVASSAYEKLIGIGEAAKAPETAMHMGVYSLNGIREVELLESEKDVAVDAIRALPLPTFAFPFKKLMLDNLLNAEKVE